MDIYVRQSAAQSEQVVTDAVDTLEVGSNQEPYWQAESLEQTAALSLGQLRQKAQLRFQVHCLCY